jgi:hypothetical protein
MIEPPAVSAAKAPWLRHSLFDRPGSAMRVVMRVYLLPGISIVGIFLVAIFSVETLLAISFLAAMAATVDECAFNRAVCLSGPCSFYALTDFMLRS